MHKLHIAVLAGATLLAGCAHTQPDTRPKPAPTHDELLYVAEDGTQIPYHHYQVVREDLENKRGSVRPAVYRRGRGGECRENSVLIRNYERKIDALEKRIDALRGQTRVEYRDRIVYRERQRVPVPPEHTLSIRVGTHYYTLPEIDMVCTEQRRSCMSVQDVLDGPGALRTE